MNRPRNRQNRQPPNQSSRRGRPHSNNSTYDQRSSAPSTPQQASGTVPLASQVTSGSKVYIILKEHQSTGKETLGTVQDVLTRGDHWRGVKVRLRGGLVGRVQRLADDSTPAHTSLPDVDPTVDHGESIDPPGNRAALGAANNSRFQSRYRDIRQDEGFEYLEEPPARSLADFMPLPPDTGGGGGGAMRGRGGEGFGDRDRGGADEGYDFHGAKIKCPVCEAFEGDESAVTHHIEAEHF